MFCACTMSDFGECSFTVLAPFVYYFIYSYHLPRQLLTPYYSLPTSTAQHNPNPNQTNSTQTQAKPTQPKDLRINISNSTHNVLPPPNPLHLHAHLTYPHFPKAKPLPKGPKTSPPYYRMANTPRFLGVRLPRRGSTRGAVSGPTTRSGEIVHGCEEAV